MLESSRIGRAGAETGLGRVSGSPVTPNYPPVGQNGALLTVPDVTGLNRVIDRRVARRMRHVRACRCRRCAAGRVRLKRAARVRGLLGYLDVPGLTMALSDWSKEKRLIEAEVEAKP